MVTKKVHYITVFIIYHHYILITEVFRLEFNVVDIGLCVVAIFVGITYFITKVTVCC